MRLFILLFSLFVLPSDSASSAELPKFLVDLIQTQYPGGKVLKSTKCELGAKAYSSFGLIIRKEADEGSNEMPLVPAIAIKKHGRWTLNEQALDVSYERGFRRNYLGDFWDNENGVTEKYELRCTVPNVDEDITTSANGLFTEKFRSSSKSGNHICFQADAVYNSWTCSNLAKDTGQIENSFNQLNAD